MSGKRGRQDRQLGSKKPVLATPDMLDVTKNVVEKPKSIDRFVPVKELREMVKSKQGAK